MATKDGKGKKGRDSDKKSAKKNDDTPTLEEKKDETPAMESVEIILPDATPEITPEQSPQEPSPEPVYDEPTLSELIIESCVYIYTSIYENNMNYNTPDLYFSLTFDNLIYFTHSF